VAKKASRPAKPTAKGANANTDAPGSLSKVASQAAGRGGVEAGGLSRKDRIKAATKAVTDNNARNLKKSASKSAPEAAPKAPPAKSPLTKGELKEFHGALIAKRRELIGDMAGIENEALGADRQESKGDISDHPADAGTDNFEQEFSLGLLESERTILKEIDEALRRIEEGTYGICVGTGMVISKARLLARPWSKYGIEYARMVEKGLVRPGDRASGYGQDEGDDRDEDDDEPDSESATESDAEPEAEAEVEVETEPDSDVE
jgi:RNA polymerase-binding transcription factor DksA